MSRTRLSATLLVCLLSAPVATAQRSGRPTRATGTQALALSARDVAAIRAALSRADDAWNARNADAFSEQFTPDVDFLLDGANLHAVGRDSLRQVFASSLARTAPDRRQRSTLEHAELVEPGVAFADIRVMTERLGADSGRTPLRTFTGSILSVRQGDAWRTRVVRLRLIPPDSASAISTARREIDAANARWVAAFNAGDIAGSATVYAPDGMVLPSNSPAITGRPAIQQFWQGGWGMGIRNVKLTTDDLTVSGDRAMEVGRYQFDVKPATGASGADHGKYIVLWKRSPTEGWQWYRDIFNSDVSAR